MFDVLKALGAAFASARAKEPDELSDLERIAVLWFAGVEIETVFECDKAVMRTKRRAGIAKIDGKFHVAEEAPRRGDTITIPRPLTGNGDLER